MFYQSNSIKLQIKALNIYKLYLLFKKNLINLKFLLSRFLRHTGLCSFFYIKQEKFIIRFFPFLYLLHCGLIKAIQKMITKQLKVCQKGATFDVGANVGHLSLYAKTCVGRRVKLLQ